MSQPVRLPPARRKRSVHEVREHFEHCREAKWQVNQPLFRFYSLIGITT
ncbi:hypothetical protein A678_04316 [Salmonella enterica subsp. enterica serovar Enteritidis str. 2010K-0271]|uniref:Uncharacterized protein n=2 Tax=Salmonella enterica I TaxID=59201 RepID=A0A0F6B905_SALT1|nr:hypothetical protein SPAB_04775 [Salmonella enterica subsp. enterica serovar Paratyphi B str. SPB7]ACY91007.1 hypothetical protein STM14_4630 [Salmonella enterica subsp. enterica serovar Typhimurium str. 14028S]EPI94052.1 hypothetical protein A678_04316 [Salmonella enterica subsp. enterica serovar Enteritidis str. 2010K-0271]EPI95478.1 hypothetical protein A677_04342 [Salmonella enterica subsp. enterica serovar Enteritidis str. 2010K-0267]